MERKRKLPARAAREEKASKKRTSTPPEPRSLPTPPPPPVPVEEPLPKNISAGKPLPTVDSPQANDLPSKEFQTIAQSGVLEESLKRSKAKWLSEGIFERYWTKPTKKKGADLLPNNPLKETMTKLGTCQITVEPHIFDAQMYGIKEPAFKPASTPTQQTMYRPIIQYGPPNGVMPPPPPPPAPIPPPVKQEPPQPDPPKPQDNPMANSHITHTQTQQNGMGPNGQQPPLSSTDPAPQVNGPKTDPVIQMLAERAATDPELKGLMRIVANGEATQDQLKNFQSHIDELTQLQKALQAAAAHPQPPPHNQPPPPPPPSTAQVNGHVHQPLCSRQSPAPIIKAAPTPPPPSPVPQPQPQYQAQPQALRSKGPVPNTKPDITGIVFEFTGGSGDRFLFPKFSILEYLPQGQVIASFLIVRKGSSGDSLKYDPELDYYQPITIRLYAHQNRQLDHLQKVVAPAEEVRRYMDDVMDNVTRAEYVLLAMQLPKESSDSTPAAEKDEDTEMRDANSNQVLWATTNPTPPPVIKPVRKLPTEEENYQGFIATVAQVV